MLHGVLALLHFLAANPAETQIQLGGLLLGNQGDLLLQDFGQIRPAAFLLQQPVQPAQHGEVVAHLLVHLLQDLDSRGPVVELLFGDLGQLQQQVGLFILRSHVLQAHPQRFGQFLPAPGRPEQADQRGLSLGVLLLELENVPVGGDGPPGPVQLHAVQLPQGQVQGNQQLAIFGSRQGVFQKAGQILHVAGLAREVDQLLAQVGLIGNLPEGPSVCGERQLRLLELLFVDLGDALQQLHALFRRTAPLQAQLEHVDMAPPIAGQRVVGLQYLGNPQRTHPAALEALQDGDRPCGQLRIHLLTGEDLVAQYQ